MLKTLFWVIVVSCVLVLFPAVAAGAVALVVLVAAVLFLAIWIDSRKTMRKAEEERKRSEAARREMEAMDRKWAEAAAERRELQKKEAAKKRLEAEEAARACAERIAQYNRLAKEAAMAGELDTARSWRRLAAEELEKYKHT